MKNETIISPADLDTSHLRQDPELEERAKRLGMGSTALKNVYPYFGGQYQVRLYVGRSQVCLAHGGLVPCIRFADCALHYFWPYRRKPNRPIIETDLNLGAAHAVREVKSTDWLREHFECIEQIMVSRKLLDPAKKRTGRARPTRAELLGEWDKFRALMVASKEYAIEANARAYEDSIDQFSEFGDKLVQSMDRQFFQKGDAQ
jgi:hypothetical protein